MQSFKLLFTEAQGSFSKPVSGSNDIPTNSESAHREGTQPAIQLF